MDFVILIPEDPEVTRKAADPRFVPLSYPICFFFICIVGVESRSTRHCGHLMAYCVRPG
jgi:hypothetical protein